MCWGNPDLYMIKLNKDMTSTQGSIVTYPKIKDYQEGPWVYKHGNNYYMTFASTCCAEGIGYAMSDKITGPWTYKGDIMPHSSRSNGNHPGIIDFKGKSYVFGLNYELWRYKSEKMGQKYQHKERRTGGLSEMKYNADGTIQKIDYWPDNGVAQLEDFDPYKRVEAETMSWGEDVRVRKSGTAGNTVITNISEGKYTKISGEDIAYLDVARTRARGDVLDGDVVNIHIIGAAAIAGQGDMVAIAGVVSEGHLEHLPVVEVRGADRVDGNEGVEVVGVGHGTHHDVVVGRSLVGGKGNLECVEGEVQFGQDQG